MTSVILAAFKTKGYMPFYLVMDENNCLSYVTGNGRHYMINNKPISNVLAYQLAEESAAVFPDKTMVHWLFDIHKKKLECVVREKGKDRDNVYRIIIAEAMVREVAKPVKTHDDLKRRVSMEVRFLPLLIENPTKSDRADIIGTVEDIGELTPKEMAQMFPAEKRYDGNGCFKDYFTSTKFLNSLEDKPMGTEGALHFLWDYTNPELDRFNLLVMNAVDNDRKQQGKSSMGEEFAKGMGIPLYMKTIDADGNAILLCDDGRTMPLDMESENNDKY